MNGSDCQVLGAGHTGITVSDIQRSVRFYRDVLGFKVTTPIHISGESVERITGVPGAALHAAFVRAGEQAIELLAFTSPEGRLASSLRPCDAGFFHLCLKVRDIEQVVSAVHAHGFEARGPVETLRGGPVAGTRVVYVRDPDGVYLELMEECGPRSFEDIMLASAT